MRRAAHHLRPAGGDPFAEPASESLLGREELAQRGVTEHSCFDIPPSSTVDELMAQHGSQDLDPAAAAVLEPIFDMDAPCVRGFDHNKFQRDGFWVRFLIGFGPLRTDFGTFQANFGLF